jgi:hypothetical protein
VEDLPSLSQGRREHGCGAYQDGEDTVSRGGGFNGQLLAFVGGRF